MRTLFLSIAGAIVLTPAAAVAQVSSLDATTVPTGAVELSHPFFSESGLRWYSSTLRARLLVPVGPTARLIADWGVSLAGDDGGTDATFANPEIGIRFGNTAGTVHATLTAILPLGFGIGDDDLSVATGFYTDPFWPERYIDDVVSINGGFGLRAPLTDRVFIVPDIGLSVLIPTNDANGGDAELFSRYGLALVYAAGPVRLRGGVEGMAVLSEEGLTFGERTAHRALFAVESSRGGPGLFVRVPLDDDFGEVNAVVGVMYTF